MKQAISGKVNIRNKGAETWNSVVFWGMWTPLLNLTPARGCSVAVGAQFGWMGNLIFVMSSLCSNPLFPGAPFMLSHCLVCLFQLSHHGQLLFFSLIPSAPGAFVGCTFPLPISPNALHICLPSHALICHLILHPKLLEVGGHHWGWINASIRSTQPSTKHMDRCPHWTGLQWPGIVSWGSLKCVSVFEENEESPRILSRELALSNFYICRGWCWCPSGNAMNLETGIE